MKLTDISVITNENQHTQLDISVFSRVLLGEEWRCKSRHKMHLLSVSLPIVLPVSNKQKYPMNMTVVGLQRSQT